MLDSGGVGRHIVRLHLLEFGKDASDLETLFEIVILVGIDKLDVFAHDEDQRVVLVVGLSITKNRVAGELNPELGTPHAIFHDFQ